MARPFALALASALITGLLAASGAAALAAPSAGTAKRAASARTSAGPRDGTRLWVAAYHVRGKDPDSDAAAVAVSPDGSRVFVTGSSAPNVGHSGGSGAYAYATVAYNPATGKALWAARYHGPLGGGNHAPAMVVSPDGSTVFVTGQAQAAGGGPSEYATWLSCLHQLVRSLEGRGAAPRPGLRPVLDLPARSLATDPGTYRGTGDPSDACPGPAATC